MEQELITKELLQAAVNLLGQLLLIVLPIVLAKTGVWVTKTWTTFLNSQPEHRMAILDAGAKFGIRAAEKMWEEDKEGRVNRLDEAAKAARDYLVHQGYKNVDDSLLYSAIRNLVDPVKTELKEEQVRKASANFKLEEFLATPK